MIRFYIILSLILSHHCQSFGQASPIEVTELGQLFANNMINSRDGGALWCQIKVLKNNSRKETNKIKIEGQVQDFVNNPENAFYIFEGYVINGNQLIVTDTILDNTELLQMDLNNEGNIWNRKRINRAFEGIFRINRRVKKEHNIYIHVIAGSLLEIRLIN